MTALKQLLDLLSPGEKLQSLYLFIMILVMAILDVIGVASIMPFMAVLSNPEIIDKNNFLSAIYKQFHFSSQSDFLFFLGVAVFLTLVLSISFKALTTYVQIRFSLMREYSIGKRLIEGYLHQPYEWFLNKHSADLGKNILSQVVQIIHGAMLPMILMLTQGAVAIGILALLFYVDPKLAIIVGVSLGAVYAVIYLSFSKYLNNIGRECVDANRKRYTAVNEAFGAAKEVKVSGLEKIYVERFSQPAKTFAHNQSSSSVAAQLPSFALEAAAFGGMILLILFLMRNDGGFATALPVISLYAFAGYRLLPALKQIYSSISQLRYTLPALEELHSDLTSLRYEREEKENKGRIQFNKSIILNSVSYSYPGGDNKVLNNLSLNIPVKCSIGLVGTTGSGKTTTVDIILGLLLPQAGNIEVDGVHITKENRRSWQKIIGYVPQQINLVDDTIEANIAFGVESTLIDFSAVQRAAKIADLHDFISNKLPDGYKTIIGERGVRLSGGQRQRIGIARALYHKPDVLILDEATSALDNLTEQAVMQAMHNIGHEITVILIAHRLSTVKDCDQIYFLNQGVIISQGKYDELIKTNEQFRLMAGEN